jgi:MYXO-CTERM domain-containing protein
VAIDADTGEVVDERWATVVLAALVAALLVWWRRRDRAQP